MTKETIMYLHILKKFSEQQLKRSALLVEYKIFNVN